jgi:hypothetical protein
MLALRGFPSEVQMNILGVFRRRSPPRPLRVHPSSFKEGKIFENADTIRVVCIPLRFSPRLIEAGWRRSRRGGGRCLAKLIDLVLARVV